MAKCIRCGKSTVVRGHIKLEDAAICTPCFKALGFKLTDATTSSLYRYEDIIDGKDTLPRKMAERKRKHEKWLEEHSDVADLMAAIREGNEKDLEADPDEDDLEEKEE